MPSCLSFCSQTCAWKGVEAVAKRTMSSSCSVAMRNTSRGITARCTYSENSSAPRRTQAPATCAPLSCCLPSPLCHNQYQEPGPAPRRRSNSDPAVCTLPMLPAVRQLIETLYHAGRQCVLAVAGGGVEAAAQLLTVPGGSRSVLEVIVPYHERALIDFLGHAPE